MASQRGQMIEEKHHDLDNYGFKSGKSRGWRGFSAAGGAKLLFLVVKMRRGEDLIDIWWE